MHQFASASIRLVFALTLAFAVLVVIPCTLYVGSTMSDLGNADAISIALWYLFSYLSGLSMTVLPCVLPLVFVVVPLSAGKGLARGLGVSLSFGLGVALMLSVYGALAASVGHIGIDLSGASTEHIKDWAYFFVGILAYAFALGELGLLDLRAPTYVGPAPVLFLRRKEYAHAFLLGIFLGNLGIGNPHPAIPILLTEAAVSGNVFYGWTLFFANALGRVLPLVLLSLLATTGMNVLDGLIERKRRIERASGWGMIFVSGFLIVLGLYTRVWWEGTGASHALSTLVHFGDLPAALDSFGGTRSMFGEGLFGQPVAWGGWTLLLLWVVPFWWQYAKERRRTHSVSVHEFKRLERVQDRIEEERRGLEVTLHLAEGKQGTRYAQLEKEIDALEKERRVLEEAMKYGVANGIRTTERERNEREMLWMRRNWYLTLTVLLFVLVGAAFV